MELVDHTHKDLLILKFQATRAEWESLRIALNGTSSQVAHEMQSEISKKLTKQG